MRKDFQKKVKLRLVSVALVLMCCGGAILARLYYLQVVYHQKLSSRADSQIYEEVRVAPKRGDITDRNGRKLAVNVEVDSLFGVPRSIDDPSGAARDLARHLGGGKAGLEKELSKDRGFVWLRRQISPAVAAEIRELGLEGVGFLKENRRYYPQRELAAHIVGLAGIDNQGLEGVELFYDDYLLREEVYLMLEHDARGREILLSRPPRELIGESAEVRLTIDEIVQHVAQQELARGVREAGARGGTIVVLQPATGEILAMANTPFFNPNEFQRYGPRYFRNRAVTDALEPGSILKPVLLAAALEEKAVSLNNVFDCENGWMYFKGHTLRDVHPHEELTVAEIIINSSNIGTTKVAVELGPKKYHSYLRAFGFGERTGVGLPGESGGLLRPLEAWSGLSISALAIGQEISVTALQMAAAYGALVNGGEMIRPRILKKVIDGSGREVRGSGDDRRERVIAPATSSLVRSVLEAVVAEGTGSEAAVEGYDVLGKTGTAQKFDVEIGAYSSKRYLASFAGAAPADDPRIVVIVMIDEPEGTIWGGSVAAPVFSRVAGRIMRYMNVPPIRGGRDLVAGSLTVPQLQ
jgi:cell division protein FtsI (penicillin-binding protein 3)